VTVNDDFHLKGCKGIICGNYVYSLKREIDNKNNNYWFLNRKELSEGSKDVIGRKRKALRDDGKKQLISRYIID
jgi:hemerythrin-like domain-containing protein